MAVQLQGGGHPGAVPPPAKDYLHPCKPWLDFMEDLYFHHGIVSRRLERLQVGVWLQSCRTVARRSLIWPTWAVSPRCCVYIGSQNQENYFRPSSATSTHIVVTVRAPPVSPGPRRDSLSAQQKY